MRPSAPRVLAATLTWNEQTQTRRALESLLRLDYPALEVALVDNGSTDGSYAVFKAAYPTVTLIRHRENFGYGEGVNGQIRRALETGADYLLSIDNDGTIAPEALQRMMDAAESDPRIGVVFPQVLEADKKISRSRRQAPALTGGFFLVRMEAVKKAGYINPRYFLYYDDADWLTRIYRAGYTACFIPEAFCTHQGALTVGSGSRACHYYQTRNRLYFESIYAVKPAFIFTAAVRFLRAFLLDLPAAAAGSASAKGRLEGVMDFLRAKRGPRDFESPRTSFLKRLQRKFSKGRPAPAARTGADRPLKIQVNLDWNIGDEIMASPVLERLKAKYSGSSIDVLSRHPALFENHAFVDSVNQGAAFKPDLYLDLHREIRHRKRSDYMPEMAGVTGWSEPKIYLRPEEIEAARKKWDLAGGALCIAICPEVWWLARRWPRERWIQLAERLEKEKQARLFILGQEDTAFPAGTNLVGKTGLRESCAVLSQCHLFIGHDSGPLYMALAVGTPSVGLYGPLDPGLLYPQTPGFKAVWSEIECRGCWPQSRMVYRDHCPKITPDCMTSISLETVYAAVEELLIKVS